MIQNPTLTINSEQLIELLRTGKTTTKNHYNEKQIIEVQEDGD